MEPPPQTADRSIRHKVIHGFAWLGSAKLVAQIGSWAATLIVARILDPADYGLVAIAGVFLGLADMLVEMGVTEGLIQRSRSTRRQEDGLFYINLGAAVVIYAALWSLAPWIGALYDNAELSDVLRVAGLGMILLALRSVPYALTMQQLDYRYAAITETIGQLLGAAAAIGLAIAGFGVWSLILSFLLRNAILALVYLHRLGRLPRLAFSWPEVAPLLAFAWKLMNSRLMRFTYMRADIFVIGKALGEKAAGFFDMAAQFATIPLDKIGTLFNRVAMPAVSRIKESRGEARELFLDMHHYLLLLAAPPLIGLALVAEDLIVLLLTDKWLPAAQVLQLLCLVNLLRLSGMLVSPILIARGQPNRIVVFNLACLLLLPPAFFLGVQWGVIGVALAWLLAYPLPYTMLLRDVFADLAITPRRFVASIAVPAATCAGMALAVWAAQQFVAPGLMRLVTSVLVGVAAYVVLIAGLFPQEIQRAREGIAVLRNPQTAG